MTYHYLEDFAIADIAFEAAGKNLEELFIAAADATMNVMVEEIGAIKPRDMRKVELRNGEVEMLLFDFLQELIYYKDAEQLMLRVSDIAISEADAIYVLEATLRGEKLDPERHEQRADVKAVTLHQFRVEQTDKGFKAFVILDV